jgi:hypothetical protein
MKARVATALGCVAIDLESDDAFLVDDEPPVADRVEVSLPLVIAASQAGSRIVAAVDRRPPLMISDDVGFTWREAGGGLPVGTAVAIDPENPDRLLLASATRVYLSESGGLFWRSLEVELIDITAVAFSSL